MSTNERWNKFVRDTLKKLSTHHRQWVTLADLRHELTARGTRRPAQDEHLRRMHDETLIRLMPETNRALLTREVQAAALTWHGQTHHLVRWNG